MKSWGRIVIGYSMFFAVATTSLISNATLTVTNVWETWESQATGPFSGAGDETWIGDTGPWQIATAAWPSSPAQDFAGSRSIRHTNTVASDSSVLTSFSLDPSRPTTWKVFVSGNSADVTATRGFNLVLMSDSSDPASVEAGTMNGYRIRLAGGTDSLFLEEANGAGWSTLNSVVVGFSANINQGWNILVHREGDGQWTYGFTTGAVGTAVSRGNAIIDTTVTSSTYAGMNWFSSATDANDFGFDNFLIVSVPEPSAAMIAAAGGGVLGALRRQRAPNS